MVYINTKTNKKNGLSETVVFSSKSSYQEYMDKDKIKEPLGRLKVKEVIREIFNENLDKYTNMTFSLCYITNDGLSYMDFVTGDTITPDFLNKVIMADPKKHKAVASDETNSAIGKSIVIGCTLVAIPNGTPKTISPKVDEPKPKPTKKNTFKTNINWD